MMGVAEIVIRQLIVFLSSYPRTFSVFDIISLPIPLHYKRIDITIYSINCNLFFYFILYVAVKFFSLSTFSSIYNVLSNLILFLFKHSSTKHRKIPISI